MTRKEIIKAIESSDLSQSDLEAISGVIESKMDDDEEDDDDDEGEEEDDEQ